jgi:cytochrome c oxidase cbb3-type subunit I/II
MEDPRSTSPGSIMPNFAWIVRDRLDTSNTQAKMRAMRSVGVPYTQEQIDTAPATLRTQAAKIAQALTEGGQKDTQDKEIVALIAYLQRLGTDIKAKPVASAENKP